MSWQDVCVLIQEIKLLLYITYYLALEKKKKKAIKQKQSPRKSTLAREPKLIYFNPFCYVILHYFNIVCFKSFMFVLK